MVEQHRRREEVDKAQGSSRFHDRNCVSKFLPVTFHECFVQAKITGSIPSDKKSQNFLFAIFEKNVNGKLFKSQFSKNMSTDTRKFRTKQMSLNCFEAEHRLTNQGLVGTSRRGTMGKKKLTPSYQILVRLSMAFSVSHSRSVCFGIGDEQLLCEGVKNAPRIAHDSGSSDFEENY